MTFDQARTEMKRGKSVRRQCWVTSISMTADGATVWNISAELARTCSMSGKNADRNYAPHQSDVDALDWEIAA